MQHRRLLLVIGLLAVTAGAGYLLWQRWQGEASQSANLSLTAQDAAASPSPAASATPPPTPGTEPATATTYYSSEHGYRFTYPDNWKLTKTERDGALESFVLTSPDASADQPLPAGATRAIISVSPGDDSSVSVKSKVNCRNGSCTSSQTINGKTTTGDQNFADNTAKVYTSQKTRNGFTVQAVVYSNAEEMESVKAEIDRLLESFAAGE